MNWFEPTNWSPDGVPAEGDIVTISSADSSVNVLLTNSPAALNSLTVSNRTVTFSNWMTVVTSTTVTVKNGAILTTPPAIFNGQMSNRVQLVCADFSLERGAQIDVSAKGYRGGDYWNGNGPGKGTVRGGGAGHGGRGGDGGSQMNGVGGVAYDVTNAPTLPGSGGGGDTVTNRVAAHGGGAVLINASGTVTIDGTINASAGSSMAYTGGGAGGSIYIICNTLAGSTTGVLRANGSAGQNEGGNGGGGMIAVDYQNLSGTPEIRFEAKVGTYDPWGTWLRNPTAPSFKWADYGTIWLSRTNLIGEALTQFDGQLLAAGWSSWSPDNLVVSGRTVRLANDFQLSVGNTLSVISNGTLALLGQPVFNCAGDMVLNNGRLALNICTQLVCGSDLVLTNGGRLYLVSGPTNSATTNYGGLVSVAGDMRIASGSWLYPFSHTNGGSFLLRMNNLLVLSSNCGINADNGGFLGNYGAVAGNGPGRGLGQRRGAGHGGFGGGWSGGHPGGYIYDVTNAPMQPGSSGGGQGGSWGTAGGGAVRIEATGNVTLNGVIRASATAQVPYTGGGAGGSIWIICNLFTTGTNSVLEARGSTEYNDGGGGGGGRIAVFTQIPREGVARFISGIPVGYIVQTNFDGLPLSVSVTNGFGVLNGSNGSPGTAFYFISARKSGIVLTIR